MPEFFKAVGAARFGVMAGVAAVLTAFFLYIAGAITEPPKTILYAGLEARDAAAVTAKLDAMNVKYDAKGDGGTILVPADQVTKLRMALAQENLPAAGVGYEIFDKSDAFGTTAFVQNINRLRALEGELARSIQTIDGIDSARVHLVIPERQVFSRDDQTPSASVVLKTRNVLGHEQVTAIQHLVAAAVASLSADRVAIVDDHGNLLAGGDDKSGADATSADQEQSTTDYEDRLRKRIESILASVVGAGHVRVQVAADMNYNHVSTTSESYDPDSKVIRSTQTVEQNSADNNGSGGGAAVSVANALPGAAQAGSGDASKSVSDHTEETTNYEISKTVKTSTQDGGDVKRLSVAVVVDGTGDAARLQAAQRRRDGPDHQPGEIGDGFRHHPRRPGAGHQHGLRPRRCRRRHARAQAAAGPGQFLLVQDHRGGDHVRDRAADRPVRRPPADRAHVRPQQQLQRAAADCRLRSGRRRPARAGRRASNRGAPAQLAAPAPSSIDISRIEGQVRESSIKKIGEVVDAHPEEALAIIRTWLHQPV